MMNFISCEKVEIVESCDSLWKVLENENYKTLIILDLIDTFFFHSNPAYHYENLTKTNRILFRSRKKRSEIDEKLYEHGSEIHDLLLYLKKKNIHLLVVSDRKFFSNIEFRNMLVNDKNYINNILFYSNYKKMFEVIQRTIRQYDRIVFITRKFVDIDDFDDLLGKNYQIIVYIAKNQVLTEAELSKLL